ncbi:hypothetical protein [Bacteroides thetaiotaomicron]|uniref:hypothetical protein n=1 Tax=Bacteroides thetaiotaomicron TaxID=818 RepID=UPI001F214858|nr:hypothetical protein [Bacteroides thetaiotaomicron]MCE8780848.1 hypothetical protein [Bacteroides thetaiotaomicron]
MRYRLMKYRLERCGGMTKFPSVSSVCHNLLSISSFEQLMLYLKEGAPCPNNESDVITNPTLSIAAHHVCHSR